MSKIVLNGTVSQWGISADSVRQQLDNMSGDVTIEISSFGGDFYEGMAIVNLIRAYDKGVVTTVNTAKAMSAGSHIFLAGDVRKAYSNATIMCHCAWTFAIGDTHDMIRVMSILDGIDTIQAKMYARIQGGDYKDVKADLQGEMWYIGEDQLLASGFVDEIIDSDEAPAVLTTIVANYKKSMASFKNTMVNKGVELDFDEVETNIQTCMGDCESHPVMGQIAKPKEGDNMSKEIQALLDAANTTIESQTTEIEASKTALADKDAEISSLQAELTTHKDEAETQVGVVAEIMAMAYECGASKDVVAKMIEAGSVDAAKVVAFDNNASAGVTHKPGGKEKEDESKETSWNDVIKGEK